MITYVQRKLKCFGLKFAFSINHIQQAITQHSIWPGRHCFNMENPFYKLPLKLMQQRKVARTSVQSPTCMGLKPSLLLPDSFLLGSVLSFRKWDLVCVMGQILGPPVFLCPLPANCSVYLFLTPSLARDSYHLWGCLQMECKTKLKNVYMIWLAHFFPLQLLQEENAQATLLDHERCLGWGQVVPAIRAKAVLYQPTASQFPTM